MRMILNKWFDESATIYKSQRPLLNGKEIALYQTLQKSRIQSLYLD